MGLSKHLKRALWIIALALMVATFGRIAMTPESFGQYGDFRADHLSEERARQPLHVGTDVCGGCHEERLVEKNSGGHAPVPCENCHYQPEAGSETRASAHPAVSNPPDRTQRACRICHQFMDARPKAFPQVADFNEHIMTNRLKIKNKDLGEVDETTPCIHCHNPHGPKIIVAKNG
ncbi:MAG: hypothetical protein OEV92_00140 [Nitrospinota bacterium]|nr:hypothetical protein [Nitrospinota bacterium]